MIGALTAAPPLAVAQQAYLHEASQMQALSFAVHIPLVCFGIALPSMVLFVEWLHHRTGDPLYLTLARRWTRIMAALFAVGVITGTILSIEMGMLWPGFMSRFGSVFGLGFAIEGFSFFLEAIFIGVYVYGWDRLSPRSHLLSGIPIAIAGVTGSLMVISVNAWMQHPSGFHIAKGHVQDVHPLKALFGNSFLWNELIHMYLAGYIVAGFLLASPYAIARLRGTWTRYERTACAIPLSVAAVVSPVQVLAHTTRGASEHLLGWYTNGQVKFGIAIPKLLSLLAFHNPNALLFGLLLGGRFDHATVARSGASPTGANSLLSATREGLRARFALAGLLGGLGFLTAAEAPWAHAVGVVCLFAAMILAFLAIDPARIAAVEDDRPVRPLRRPGR